MADCQHARQVTAKAEVGCGAPFSGNASERHSSSPQGCTATAHMQARAPWQLSLRGCTLPALAIILCIPVDVPIVCTWADSRQLGRSH